MGRSGGFDPYSLDPDFLKRQVRVPMARKLNVWTLGGLMVGPILGSGIVLLPPLAYRNLGSQALWAWVLTLLLGAAFAAVFIRMTLRARSDEGIASLVARERGRSAPSPSS
jgi:amino acid transporter